ncbi:MAG: DNA internalization-related competence protein ComEC/Rec2 [Proteobacteria bacterium]|nr:DNA internalization-related competence protein ComEC/Rec2 [Pseudomonadota bacterium]MBU1594422.1 DNA internalization-related competence protein ComEC/Rec2 [Pseudomonadota bacterium]
MLASQRQDSFAPCGGPPGLLAWQVYFLAYVAGIWSLRHPEPALALAGLLWAALAGIRAGGWRQSLLTLALVVLCFGAGVGHAHLVLPRPPSAPAAVVQGRGKALLRGRVAAVSDKPFGRQEILLEHVRAEGADTGTEAVPGLVSWDWDEPSYRPAPGQEVEVRLRLWPVRGFRNAGGADFDWQQRLRGVFHRAYARGELADAAWGPRPASFWWDLRESLRGSLLRLLPPTQGGAVVLGLLMGDRSRIDQTVTEELRAAGLAHTLALSGLNVVYAALLGWGLAWLAGLARPALFLRIPRQKLAILISLPLVAAYVWVGQASPSLVRSACMFGFWGLLLLFDRGRALVDGLFLALAVMVLAEPLAVFDLGLQMSALSVGGLAILFPWLRGLVPAPAGFLGRALRLGWDALAMSLAANLALLPVLAWYFGVFQPNFLLNLPWVPVQGLVVQLLGMVGMALALVPGLEQAAAWPLQAAAQAQGLMLEALHAVAQAGWLPVWSLFRPLWPELLGAGLVTALVPCCWRRPGTAPVLLVLGGLLLMAAAHGRMLWDEARDEVRLTLLDVGQSQALLVTAPGGRRVLVDGGGTSSRTFDLGRSVVGPALAWGRPPRLDAVVMSHPDADHAQGLGFILRQFRVGRFITNGQWPAGELGEAFDAALAAGAPRPEVFRPGDSLDLGSGVLLAAQHPAEDFDGAGTNERSLVLRLLWRGAPLALLPGDVQRAGIEHMIDAGRDLRAQVLVLPHHGSKSSFSGMLYEAVAPAQAAVSCGYLNQFHFPNQAVADELSRRGIPLASTSDAGMLELAWSAPGRGFRFSATRP